MPRTPTALAAALIALPFIAQAETDWTGFYAGAQIDVLNGSAEYDSQTVDLRKQVAGIMVGYRQAFDGFVLGVELDYHRGKVGASREFVEIDRDTGEVIATTQTYSFRIDRLVRLGVEAGVEMGPALVYGTAGIARIDFSGAPTADSGGSGHFYGIGVDYRVTDRVTVGAELLRHRFDDLGFAGYSADPVTFGLNIGYRF